MPRRPLAPGLPSALLCGILLCVLTAWAFAVLRSGRPHEYGAITAWTWPEHDLSGVVATAWGRQTWWLADAGPRNLAWLPEGSPLRPPGRVPAWAGRPVSFSEPALTYGYGWPRICLFHVPDSYSSWGTPTRSAWERRRAEGLIVTFRGRQAVLPLRVHTPGMVANTLFYAAAVLVLRRTPAAARGAIRRRLGRCVRCGYDLRDARADRCPECGATRPRRTLRGRARSASDGC